MTADTASIRIDAPAQIIYDYIRDPKKMDRWSFGTWHTTIHQDGLVEGRALGTGAGIFLRIEADLDRLLIDYHIGPTAGALSPRIFARVIPGAVTGHASNTATLTLTALRSATMDDGRWHSLCRAHAAELDLIKGQIESGHDPRQ
ncbi:MAG: hypothetical protein GKR97_15825 [Rhizobiaceae bacterium]|nr:hypothetical protein [Rhizobiaceae bacterium]